MKSVALTAYPRTQTRRGKVKQLRETGRIPAVIYGRHHPPQNLEIGQRELDLVIHHSATENVLLDLAVDGDPRPNRMALVQEVQHHALSGKVLHVDLHEVVADEKVTVLVPLDSVGEPLGVKTGGGVLEHVLFQVKVRGLPKDLPEVISVDVSNLEIGQSLHIGDIQAPEGVEVLGEKKIVVISVAAPVAEVVEEVAAVPGAEAAPMEPEMIREKKDEPATAAGGAPAAPAAAAAPAKKEKKEKKEKGG